MRKIRTNPAQAPRAGLSNPGHDRVIYPLHLLNALSNAFSALYSPFFSSSVN